MPETWVRLPRTNSPNSWATWHPTCKPTTRHRHTWHFRAISGSYLAATHNACTTNTLIHAAHVRRSLLLFSSSHRYLPHVQSGTFQPAAKCCQWVAHNRRLFQPTVPTNLTQVARVQLTAKSPVSRCVAPHLLQPKDVNGCPLDKLSTAAATHSSKSTCLATTPNHVQTARATYTSARLYLSLLMSSLNSTRGTHTETKHQQPRFQHQACTQCSSPVQPIAPASEPGEHSNEVARRCTSKVRGPCTQYIRHHANNGAISYRP